jgi:hypothetical protein
VYIHLGRNDISTISPGRGAGISNESGIAAGGGEERERSGTGAALTPKRRVQRRNAAVDRRARIALKESRSDRVVTQPRDQQLFELAAAAARDAIEIVRSIQGGEGFILDYLEYPHLSSFDSGFPHSPHTRPRKCLGRYPLRRSSRKAGL